MYLSIDRLHITRIDDGYVYGRDPGRSSETDTVKFSSKGWPVECDDIISIEYGLEMDRDGSPTELIDVQLVEDLGTDELEPIHSD